MEQTEAEKCQKHDRRCHIPPSRHDREFAVCAAAMKRRIDCYLGTDEPVQFEELELVEVHRLQDTNRSFLEISLECSTPDYGRKSKDANTYPEAGLGNKHWDLNRLCPKISLDNCVRFVSSHKSVYMQPRSQQGSQLQPFKATAESIFPK